MLLLERLGDGLWEGLAGRRDACARGGATARWSCVEHLGEGRWRLRLDGEPAGEVPLPPYIGVPLDDPERYQTVYARDPGSAAAPTAGLHFTPELLAALDVERVTLHVGLDTFRPVAVDDARGARAARRALRRAARGVGANPRGRPRPRRRHDVGPRLETLARDGPLAGRTALFVTPGFEFRRVDALLTNFHLPRSTLLALVMAFAGVEQTRELYRTAVEERYRFYSFGDAMLIL